MHSTERKAGTAMVGPRVAIPVGSLAGTLGGLCGVGGGIVITPFLKHFTSLTTQRITGTAMLAVTMSALGGGTTYACAGTADLPAAAMLAATASCTTGFGVAVSRRMSSRTLSRAFGGFLLGVAPLVAAGAAGKARLRAAWRSEEATPREEVGAVGENTAREGRQRTRTPLPTSMVEAAAYVRENALFGVAGVATGFSAGLLGVGGGIVMTTFMALATELSQHEAVATSVVAMIPTGISSSFFHWRAGNIHFRAAALLAVSSTAAMTTACAYVAPSVSEEQMRYLFAALLVVSGVRMLV